MKPQNLLSIGECMMELSSAGGGLLRKSFAGDTFNTAWYARQLLPRTFQVDYGSAVGSDGLSGEMLDFIHQAGIGIGAIRIIPGGRIGLYLIELDAEGERRFCYWRDTSAARRLADDPAFLRATLERSQVIHFSGITLAILSPHARETLLAELRRIRAADALVVFDPNIRPNLWEDAATMRAMLDEGARTASIVLPGLDEEHLHFGTASAQEVIARYRGLGLKTIIVKQGADGATGFSGGEILAVPAARAQQVVDTTAAGDSFDGAFIARLMQGDGVGPAIRRATEVAAEVIARPGALVTLSRTA